MSSLFPYPLGLITALLVSVIGAYATLAVARRQFSANVLSTNRHRWIETFRDRIAELLSVMKSAQVIKRTSSGRWRGGAGPVKDNPALADKLEKTFMAIAQIQLLTNATAVEHQALNHAISVAVGYLQDDDLHEVELSARWQEIITLGRCIIRQEWGRVKRGI